ncbi:MAG: TlpA family protein disulfide reductase [Bacteroidetes bacterium]|nr:TlpA family protein disulfide reductase [Bacteroidota bacterium]
MTFRLTSLITILVALFSCKAEYRSDKAVLQIILSRDNAKIMADKYVYLFDVSKKVVLDSAVVAGDTVNFSRHCNPDFVPYMVSVVRIDTFKGHPFLRPMGFQSPYNAKLIYSSFYLDKGVTILKPILNNNINEQTGFTGSVQNEPFLKRVELQYTFGNPANSQVIIKENISKIKAYPYSIYLLEQLFYNKEKFSNKDLKNQLSFFDNNLQKTAFFKNFNDYFTTAETFDKVFPSIEFENQAGKFQEVGSEDAAFYLIVFWASWCGPCREEIPIIDTLYKKYFNSGLSITSISIDGDKRNWQTALQQEKPTWQQLIAIDSTRTFVSLHYEIKAIPKAYLFNRKKEFIGKFDDASVMTKRIDRLLANGK